MSTRCPARSRSRILVARAFRSISRGARGSTAAGCFGKAEANPLIAVHAERSVGWADPGLVPREAQQPWRSAGFAALCAQPTRFGEQRAALEMTIARVRRMRL